MQLILVYYKIKIEIGLAALAALAALKRQGWGAGAFGGGLAKNNNKLYLHEIHGSRMVPLLWA